MRAHLLMAGIALGATLPLLASPALAQGYGDFAGTWSTSEGQATLDSRGSHVTGSYTQDGGRIDGDQQGGQLYGYWGENSSAQNCGAERMGTRYWGRIVWRMSGDGRRFEGRWGYCDSEPTNSWTGDRIGPPPHRDDYPPHGDYYPPHRHHGFAGAWSTSEGGMTLSSDGYNVSGNYTQDGGRISGTMRGADRLVGYWGENSSAQDCGRYRMGTRYWGRIDWTLSPDGRHFSGAWSYCNARPDHTWTGDRTGGY